MPIVVQRGALDTIMSGKATERRLRYRNEWRYRSYSATVSWIIQMIVWGLDTILEELMWPLVVVGVIAAIAVVSLLRNY